MFRARRIPRNRKGTAITSRHQRFHTAVRSSPSTSIAPPVASSRAASTKSRDRWATRASSTSAAHEATTRAVPTQPGHVRRAPSCAKAAETDHLDGRHVQRQLSRDPSQCEADDGERLPPHREVGVDRQDREGNADGEEDPGHPSIKHGLAGEVKPHRVRARGTDPRRPGKDRAWND